MGKEEQVEEREVLASIFPDEITDISDTEFRITITLDIPGDDDTDVEPPSLLLHVTYPPTYPDVPPLLALLPSPDQQKKHPHLSLPADAPPLLSHLQETITENLGMAMIFTLVSTLKDAAESLVAERQAAVRKQEEERRVRAEREENAKFHGTGVTRETFLAWRERFRREAEEERERVRVEGEEGERKKKVGQVAREERRAMTGRELWEKGLVGRVDEDEGESSGGEEVDVDALRKLNVGTAAAAAAAAAK